MCIINNKREGTLKALLGADLPNVDSVAPVRPSNPTSNTPPLWLLLFVCLFLCMAPYDCVKTGGNIQDQMVRLPGHSHL